MRRHKTVDDYIESSVAWRDELTRLRKILNSTKLVETVKWGGPCYTHDGKNVVGLGAFKSYFGLWFHQGALLADKKGVLINCQEGKTKALRQWRMTDKSEIDARTVKAYVRESIKNQEKGAEIKPARNKPLTVPIQLERALAKHRRAGTSFKGLTKGRQREYADYIADAKREETKLKRLDKIIPMIEAGQGLNDKYRNC